MRHSRRLLTILLLLSLVAAGIAGADVYRTAGDVRMIALTAEGDGTVMKGLTVSSRYAMDGLHAWDVKTIFDDHGIDEVHTDYQYKQFRTPRPEPAEAGISLTSYYAMPFYWDDDNDVDDDTRGFNRMLLDLSSRTPPGATREETFLLSDYQEYYSISGAISLPDYQLAWGDTPGGQPASFLTAESQAVIAGIEDYFRIPVLPDEKVTVSIQRDQEGQTISSGIGSAEGDAFRLRTFSVATGDAFYFTFDSHSEEGRPVDTTYIPGGYGIYRLPFEADESEGRRLLIDQLENVRSLDPTQSVQYLNLTNDGRSLAVHKLSDEDYVIDILPLEDLAGGQTIHVADWPDNVRFRDVYEGPDFLTVRAFDGRAGVMSGNAAGNYKLEFMYKEDRQEELWHHHPLHAMDRTLAMAFDGKKLAVASTAAPRQAGYVLAVIDASGTVFCGEYNSQLNLPESNPYTDAAYPTVYAASQDPLSLSWD